MKLRFFSIFPILLLSVTTSCGNPTTATESSTGNSSAKTELTSSQKGIIPGADQLEEYLPLLKGKKVGLMGNQTSVVGNEHLVDVLLEHKVDIKFAFAPEHGFRGDIERGEKVSND